MYFEGIQKSTSEVYDVIKHPLIYSFIEGKSELHNMLKVQIVVYYN